MVGTDSLIPAEFTRREPSNLPCHHINSTAISFTHALTDLLLKVLLSG